MSFALIIESNQSDSVDIRDSTSNSWWADDATIKKWHSKRATRTSFVFRLFFLSLSLSLSLSHSHSHFHFYSCLVIWFDFSFFLFSLFLVSSSRDIDCYRVALMAAPETAFNCLPRVAQCHAWPHLNDDEQISVPAPLSIYIILIESKNQNQNRNRNNKITEMLIPSIGDILTAPCCRTLTIWQSNHQPPDGRRTRSKVRNQWTSK